MAEPLDTYTWLRVTTTLEGARKRGMDPAEALHRMGLLLTPVKEMNLKKDGMEFLLGQIRSWRPVEFLRRKFNPSHQASPADLYQCMVEFVEEHINTIKESK